MNEVQVLRLLEPHSSLSNYHENKEIFINEGGLYRLIMRSNKPNAEPFQDFVQDVLLPNIRKQIVENLNSENNSLKQNVNILIKQNSTLITEVQETRKQNNLALKRLEDMGISLEETRDQLDEIQEELIDTNQKLDFVLPDRNIDPENRNLKHSYILFKNKILNNEYIFIRGQDKYIKNKKNAYKTEFEITIDSTKNPNPIDLINRLKEKIQKINEERYLSLIENLKSTEEYLSLSSVNKRKLIYSMKKNNSLINYRVNKIILNNYPEELFLNIIKNLDSEKYNV